jgi:hypothetical protein
MKIYKSESKKNNLFDGNWIYKSYLFKNNNNENIGTIILFKNIEESSYRITIIKALKERIGTKMIEIALNDTPEGILPSQEKYISESAMKMWNRINSNPVFKKQEHNVETRINNSKNFLNCIYKINIKTPYNFIPMNASNIKDSIEIGSKELLEQNYVGASKFLENDLSKILISTKEKKHIKRKFK